jgi:putative Holliday junction resolvase
MAPGERGRILGIDHGDARTGVAVSDPLGLTAQPREVLAERDRARLVEAVARIAEELDAKRIVVGLPVNMDGSEGRRARAAREFGARLARRVDCPVGFWDERLTSVQAERALRALPRRARAKVDVVSAQIMLQGYLDARRGERD